ncbi:MAG: protein phosphatase 2C domain-containing protein [Candidatus Methanofastidiosia archaeon]|jgi:protein phosphatase
MEYSGISHRGMVRTHNEDNAFAMTMEIYGLDSFSCGLFIVCDGVGGEACGEIASRLAVKVTSQKVMESLSLLDTDNLEFEQVLQSAIKAANKAVIGKMKESPKYEGMATTISAVLAIDCKAYIGQVGDSRTYIFGPQLFCSKDHSLVQEEVEKNILTKEEARLNSKRSIITRALGIDPHVEIDTYTHPLYAESTILVCSDGLWEELSDAEIEKIVSDYSSPREISKALQKTANKRGGHDNISMVVVQNKDLPKREELKKSQTIIASVKEQKTMWR